MSSVKIRHSFVLCIRLNEVNMAMTDEKRKRQDTAHTMEIMNRDWEHAAETEKLRTQTKLTEGIEEINKRLLGKEISLREEIRCTTQSIEKVVMVVRFESVSLRNRRW